MGSNSSRVGIVLPVLNEEKILRESVEKLRIFLIDHFPYEWTIIVADNGSIDRTSDVIKEYSNN